MERLLPLARGGCHDVAAKREKAVRTAHFLSYFPLPLWERVDRTAKRFETGEGLPQTPNSRHPSSVFASRSHLLPQGEKEGRMSRYVAIVTAIPPAFS
jgi:hypothetical protein